MAGAAGCRVQGLIGSGLGEVAGELGPLGFQAMIIQQLGLYMNRKIVDAINRIDPVAASADLQARPCPLP